MSDSTDIEVVHAFMRAFDQQDRERAEALMAGVFVFTTPQDDHIDKD